ncbi:hypothetical protein ACIBF5_09615 [Micromonospora sp. NPDC050417]|uniref:hypothetical protein n=1 Tax=Micromonospora sp. NPDC050417 TaxID=3364280 RepID=UPI0037991B21
MIRRTRPTPAPPVYSEPCTYQADPSVPPGPDGAAPCRCHLPLRHARHQAAIVAAAQTEHRRRVDRDDT